MDQGDGGADRGERWERGPRLCLSAWITRFFLAELEFTSPLSAGSAPPPALASGVLTRADVFDKWFLYDRLLKMT